MEVLGEAGPCRDCLQGLKETWEKLLASFAASRAQTVPNTFAMVHLYIASVVTTKMGAIVT